MARTFTIPSEPQLGLHKLTNPAGLSISILPCGTLFSIEHQGIMINQLFGTPLGEGVMRIAVRERASGICHLTSLVGAGHTRFLAQNDNCIWQADGDGVTCTVTLRLHPELLAWTWHVDVTSTATSPLQLDCVLVQDLGIASRGQILNNEAYTSQYLDHAPLQHAQHGWVVCTRQALPQHEGRCPWLLQSCLNGADAYATDGLQLFGLTHKRDGVPAFHTQDLPSTRLQHEAAWIGLQSKAQSLEPGNTASWTFIAIYEPDHRAATSDNDLQRLDSIAGSLRLPGPGTRSVPAIASSILRDAPLLSVRPVELQNVIHKEILDDQLASCFLDAGTHVVLPPKELASVRRTGHIIRSSSATQLDETVMCNTAWMTGVFASQITLGNTSFHKLFSVARDHLSVIRSTGLRILVKIDDQWRLLGIPSTFHMDLDRCGWSYRFNEQLISVGVAALPESPAVTVSIHIVGEPMECMIVGHIVAGNHEYEAAGRIEIMPDQHVVVRPDPSSLFGQKYPDAAYTLIPSDHACVFASGGDELLYADHRAPYSTHIVIQTRATNAFSLTILGDLRNPQKLSKGPEKHAASRGYWPSLIPLTKSESKDTHWSMLADSLPWLTHNAMVHLTTPRGLEQNSGAAWGVRDVCQGPVEFLLASDRAEVVRDILKVVFAQQWDGRHEWPQWFMHPPYENIRDSHSHGDVIVWPLKALCDYLEHTADFSLLDEVVPYFDEKRFAVSEKTDTILAHVDKLIARVKQLFIPGTSLIRYGEGDWNDALQPADPKLRDTMVSSWTVALLYHTLRRWREALQRIGDSRKIRDIESLLTSIHADFHKHLMCDGIVAGYALIEGGKVQRHLLHPSDRVTGIHYSLIPMTRGMLAHLFTKEQAQRHLQLIREHLLAPDGARLMDRPPTYRGGLMTIFKRAESSSFFGREIGLQYVHAHLRYCEAMALLGEADALYDGLLAVNPIAVTQVVKGAAPRQRNAYFSSSDAAFTDHYEADRDYTKAMHGDIRYDGGWRIYSSGPGLYLNMVVRHMLGIRRYYGKLILDPVLPKRLDGLSVEHRSGLKLTYHVGRGFAPSLDKCSGMVVEGSLTDNPYRQGGVVGSAKPQADGVGLWL